MIRILRGLVICNLVLMSGCVDEKQQEQLDMNRIAESYVKLVLKIGLYDPDYVDAYYGPPEWKPEQSERQSQFPYQRFRAEISRLSALLENIDQETLEPLEQQRYIFLQKLLQAAGARVDFLNGRQMSFDEESRAIYDAVAPSYHADYFEKLLQDLDAALPGKGRISERLINFKKEFIIPPEKLDTVFRAAIEEARKRTLQYIALPENENFKVEYVTDKSWSGYNWYKGNNFSLIQINTDLPIYVDRAIDLACHEGYPGHHVFNVLLEKYLVRDRRWMEFSVYPLFSPQSLIAEGSANFGIQVAFPGEERVKFEKEVIFPLAGLDPDKAQQYYDVFTLTKKLNYAGNEAARQYLDGKMTHKEALAWLEKYALMTPQRASQRLRFIEQYRSYVINYNLGEDLVIKHVEERGGTADNPQKRWELFATLLSAPQIPSGL